MTRKSCTNRDLPTTIIALLLLLYGFAVPVLAKVPTVQIGNNTVKLEVASTAKQIERGLMYRQSMPEDHGMVFIFDPPNGVKFWMAHCFMSLDMLFIKNGKIIKIFENVPPCKASDEKDCPTYPGRNEQPIKVSEVVEVNSGYAKRHAVKVGEIVNFTLGAAVKVVPSTTSDH